MQGNTKNIPVWVENKTRDIARIVVVTLNLMMIYDMKRAGRYTMLKEYNKNEEMEHKQNNPHGMSRFWQYNV